MAMGDGTEDAKPRREAPPGGDAFPAGSTSRKKAVEAFCKECLYDPLSAGTWRMQIELCSAYACPLWRVRPVRAKKDRSRYPRTVWDQHGRWLPKELEAALLRDPHEYPRTLERDPAGGYRRKGGPREGLRGEPAC